jgi:hypothetical protein
VDEARGPLRVPDAQLDFGPDLVMHYQGRPFTGVSYEVMEDGTRSELTYVGLRNKDRLETGMLHGRLRTEEFWHGNLRHGPSRTYDESGAAISEQWWDHGRQVDAPPPEV